jgi:hypothetical protein
VPEEEEEEEALVVLGEEVVQVALVAPLLVVREVQEVCLFVAAKVNSLDRECSWGC